MHITALTLHTGNLDATARFYGGVLGLATEITADAVTIKAGSTTIQFEEAPGEQPQYHFAFNIPCNQIHEAVAWLRSRVPLIEPEPGNPVIEFKNWNAHAVYFFDNNGSILEFIARRDLDNAGERPFDAASLLCVSEMGIVTDDPVRFAEKLHTDYDIPYFSKNKNSAQFVVLGDDEGLLIVVSAGRHWYLTQIPAQPFYSKINFGSKGRRTELCPGSAAV